MPACLNTVPGIAMICLLAGCSSIHTIDNADIAASGEPIPTRNQAQVVRLDSNAFRVSVPVVAVRQPAQTQWCWLACGDMVLRTQGVQIPKEDLTTYFAGNVGHQTSTVLGMMRVLNPDLEKDYFEKLWNDNPDAAVHEGWRIMRAERTAKGVNSDWLLTEMSAGNPAVVGLRDRDAAVGHICIINGATYSIAKAPDGVEGWFLDGFQGTDDKPNRDDEIIKYAVSRDYQFKIRYVLHEVELIDPDPSYPMVSKMTAAEFRDQVEFIITPRLSRAVIREMIRNAPRKPKRPAEYRDKEEWPEWPTIPDSFKSRRRRR